MFQKILIANRGEIALRILRAAKELGIQTVVVHSTADADAMHVRLADESVCIGPPASRDSYLNIHQIVAACEITGADAVHPGYGLLSENAGFAGRVAEAGATFVGPPIRALEAFGDKIKARAVARAVGVQPPPGTDGPIDPADVTTLAAEAGRIGFPILVKAAGGGGGIGMQLVREEGDLERAARACSDRGKAAFADARIYMERYVDGPRHIEVQVFRDRAGNTVALGERECSVQRRHQKIVEEAPSPASFFAGAEGASRRNALHESARKVVEITGLTEIFTIED